MRYLAWISDSLDVPPALSGFRAAEQWPTRWFTAAPALAALNGELRDAGCAVVQVGGEEGIGVLRGLAEREPHVPRVALLAPGAEALVYRVVNEGRASAVARASATEDELRVVVSQAVARALSVESSMAVVERKVQERTVQLASGKREWELTFDTISIPLFVITSKAVIARANVAGARAVGVPITSVPGRPYQTLVYGDEAVPDGCPIAAVLAGESQREAEITLAGDRVLFVRAFGGRAGEFIICSAEDVTHESRRRRTAFHTEKMAALGQLAGGVAHEINNPLATILAFSSLLKDDVNRSAEDKEALSAIEESAQRCRRIVENMLRFSRREATRRPADLSAIARDAAALFRIQVKQCPRVEFEVELEEGLPPLEVNVAQCEQVILNLLQNALHALPLTTGTVGLRTKLEATGVVITVRDTGVGIPPENLSRIFEPCFTTKAEGQGTGLGLTIVESIVKEHRGTLAVDSVVGQGTEFTIHLPLGKEAP